MNDHQYPPRAFYKRQARQTIVHSIRPVMAVSGIVLAFQLAARLFQINFGGILNYYMFNAADYASSSGIWMAENGVTAILRLDAAGVLFALPLSYHQITVFFLSNLLLFLVMTPLFMGALEQFQAILLNRFRSVSEIFRWYGDLRLTAKAVGLGFVLSLIKWAARAAFMAPGLVLFARAAENNGSTAYLLLSYALILAGAAVSYWVYTLILPARYLLAREPGASVRNALSRGVQAVRNRRRNYFQFRLSFLLWYAAVSLSYEIMGFFVLPYTELANLIYLREAAPEQKESRRTLLQEL